MLTINANRYGNKFVKRCRDYLHAEEEAVELLVAIESNWVKIETQIEILKGIAHNLNKRLQNSQALVLSQLEGKLKTASLIIDQLYREKKEARKEAATNKKLYENWDMSKVKRGLEHMTASKKLKYVYKKTTLYQIVEEIEKWQARYDPTWILIMQMSTGITDEGFNEQQEKAEKKDIPIILAARGIREASRAAKDDGVGDKKSIWIESLDMKEVALPFSSVLTSKLPDTGEKILIDTMVSNPASNNDRNVKEVRNLARILAEVDPDTFGLLKCRGVMKVVSPKQGTSTVKLPLDFKLIFSHPPNLHEPRSLRCILSSGEQYPLEERLGLAKKLASSVLFVHTVHFVHKNIRPETIIVFKNEQSKIGAPYLAGFEQFRIEDGNTYRAGDDVWEHNLCKSSPPFDQKAELTFP